jgi:hypothetical protein
MADMIVANDKQMEMVRDLAEMGVRWAKVYRAFVRGRANPDAGQVAETLARECVTLEARIIASGISREDVKVLANRIVRGHTVSQ